MSNILKNIPALRAKGLHIENATQKPLCFRGKVELKQTQSTQQHDQQLKEQKEQAEEQAEESQQNPKREIRRTI